MHQHPRPLLRTGSGAGNPSTNIERANAPQHAAHARKRSSVDLSTYTERAAGDADAGTRAEVPGAADRENTKLNQIVQNFYTKAALMICSARATLPQVHTKNGDIKQNRWFNLVLDETDVLNEALMPWKGQNLLGTTPPPLVVEVYVDTAQLNHNQALAVEDDQGNLWNVADTMADSQDSDTALTRNGNPYCEVVLERWTISLGSASSVDADDPTDQLPNVYKKGVVLFRSLYTYLRLLPTWKLYRRLGRQAGNQQSLKLKFRIRQQREGVAEDPKDPLAAPLYPSPSTSSYRSGKHRHTDGYVGRRRFEPLVCSAGRLHLVVDYRSSQALSVADSESLLSTRFVGLDQSQRQPHFTNTAGRSLPGARSSQHYAQGSYGASQTGNTSGNRVPRALLGAYGSLNTFHTTGKRDSPITEISRHHIYDEDDSMDRRNTVRDELRPRSRPSSDLMVNPPFKAGSLASSPRPDDGRPGSIRISKSPPMPIPAKQTTQISSSPVQRLTDGRTPPHLPRRASPIAAAERLNRGYSPSDLAVASSGSSNAFGGGMAAPKYSSSFANRPRRLTPASGGDNQSAGSSGASGQIPAPRSPITSFGGASSGTAANDDDDIASFIADLKKTELRSSGKPAVPKSFSVNLAQFDKLKDGSAALADEMELSTANLITSTPPSRRLSNVPGLSTSSSPSRAIAAHAPHVRSRLSAHSIAEEVSGSTGSAGGGGGSGSAGGGGGGGISGGSASGGSARVEVGDDDDADDEEEEPFLFAMT